MWFEWKPGDDFLLKEIKQNQKKVFSCGKGSTGLDFGFTPLWGVCNVWSVPYKSVYWPQSSNQRLTGWSLFLQDNLDLKHMPGKHNLVADALSCCRLLIMFFVRLPSTEHCIWDYCGLLGINVNCCVLMWSMVFYWHVYSCIMFSWYLQHALNIWGRYDMFLKYVFSVVCVRSVCHKVHVLPSCILLESIAYNFVL